LSKILVTGGLGFVGNRLVLDLIRNGHHPVLLVRNGQEQICNDRFGEKVECLSLETIIKDGHEIDISAVVNLAGKYWFNPNDLEIRAMIESNITLPSLIADSVTRGFRNITWIQASTFMQHFNSSVYDPTCFYAATKQSAENSLFAFRDRGLTLKSLVLPHIFGEHDNRNKLLNYLVGQARDLSPIKVSSGTQIMDLVHVDDIVSAIQVALRYDVPAGRYQISSNKMITIHQIVDFLTSRTASDFEVEFDAKKDRKRDTYEIWDCAPSLPTWDPSIDLFHWIEYQMSSSADIR
jgi:nucleoside-diphosphate-sugar epimerase